MVQSLSPNNIIQRLDFANQMLYLFENNKMSNEKILFSDDAHFYLHEYVNKQNMIIWGSENPHVPLVNPHHPTRISVWCAISSRGIYGPWFIEGNVNSQNYKSLLEKEFIPFCQGMDCLVGYWFMQDGARPHHTQDVFQMLLENFGTRLFGLGFPDYAGDGIE